MIHTRHLQAKQYVQEALLCGDDIYQHWVVQGMVDCML